MTARVYKLPIVPASFFGIVLGLGGLGGAWRVAHRVWGLPSAVGESLLLLAALVWLTLIVLFALKWLVAREAATSEAFNPIQCCFIGLAGVSTMVIALAALPWSQLTGLVLFGSGATFTIGFAVWRTGLLWQGGREPGGTTPVLYLPTVAGGFVTAIAASAYGFTAWAQLAFGVGVLTWLAIESVLLNRLYLVSLPPPLRPTLGIQLAPPAVGLLAYISVRGEAPDLIAHALIGYALLQALLLLRLLPWIREQAFSAGYWSFTFGATALATAALRLDEHGGSAVVTALAPVLFVGANAVVGLIAIGTVRLILQGKLLPPSAPVVIVPATAPASSIQTS